MKLDIKIRWWMYVMIFFSSVILFSGCQSREGSKQTEMPDSQNSPLDSALSYLTEPVTQTVVGDFKVISPARKTSEDTITADGYTTFDERVASSVTARVSGRIEKLYVKYTNQPVHIGQPLMKIYSPQLLSIQRNLLQAVKDKDTAIITGLKNNLFNLGMPSGEVQKVIEIEHPKVNITIYSPYEGVSQNRPSVGKNVTGSSELLSIQKGMYVNEGQILFSIQSISRIWAILNVFSKDLANISQGDPVILYAAANPTKMIKGKVGFIPPFRIGDEKTSRVRVYLNQIPKDWKIGTLLLGKIAVKQNSQGWTVPLSAVNRLGLSSVVWVRDKKYLHVFHAVKVETEQPIGDSICIVSGLQDNDKIVENAAYMVDSDSFIQ